MVVLLYLLKVSVEFSKLIREDVSVWDEVELSLPMLLLHLYRIEAQSILPRDFVTMREMVDLLVLVQPFI